MTSAGSDGSGLYFLVPVLQSVPPTPTLPVAPPRDAGWRHGGRPPHPPLVWMGGFGLCPVRFCLYRFVWLGPVPDLGHCLSFQVQALVLGFGVGSIDSLSAENVALSVPSLTGCHFLGSPHLCVSSLDLLVHFGLVQPGPKLFCAWPDALGSRHAVCSRTSEKLPMLLKLSLF